MYSPISNHTVVIAVRWLSLAITALLLIGQQRTLSDWLALSIVVGLTTAASFIMQSVARWAVRYPALLAIDVLIAAALIAWSSPWGSPFYPYVIAVLVLPALVSGWRGGLLAGVLFASLVATFQYTVNGMPVLDPQASVVQLLMVYLVPACLGAGMPMLLTWLRSMYDRQLKAPQPLVLPPLSNLSDVFRENVIARRRPASGMSSGSTTSVTTRVEELRIALYAPAEPQHELAGLLAQVADRFEQSAMIATRVVVLGRPQAIQAVHLPVVRRVVIEALLNVEQHAQAHSVSIMARFDQRNVTIMVQDDGQGLPATGIQRAGLHSLHALMYRSSELGGRLEVFNNVSSGVAVRLVLPLLAQDVL